MKNVNGEEISNTFDKKPKKLKIWKVVLISIFGFGIIGSILDDSEPGYVEASNNIEMSDNVEVPDNNETEEIIIQICDGINVVEDCELDGKEYVLYKYYPPVAEKSHTETITKYETKIVGYCTLCNDGTRSPSCATGRGTCSHHNGVAEWNAPIYKEVPYDEEIKVVDALAITERYEIKEKE